MDPGLIEFSDGRFNSLSIREWYAVSSLRESVFVVEQNCPYLDADGKDIQAHHIIGRAASGVVLAYARIVHPADQCTPISKMEYLPQQQKEQVIADFEIVKGVLKLPAIGRVVLDPSLRGKGYGDSLMTYTITCFTGIYNRQPAFLSAQKPLHDFYARHGFLQTGPEYLEDGIPHIPMICFFT